MISQTYQRYWMYVNIHLKDSNSPVKMKFTIFAVVFIYFLNHGVFHVQAEIEESLADLMLEQLYSLKCEKKYLIIKNN
ncbi:unnamed protein product [Acanthoscelides obtectus]|uniref:Uncharacterized protein n=1 Tax=Acanthoscelides obtectus TaxID=200917 RepID=A0A9P0JPZ0_ACAOB|nr:unnamed protein product [Acanthoscelides obtectus]CAK1625858.1 hypothetical protein AOBTE_LOCUS3447 [Acanthoscelides obtectus]